MARNPLGPVQPLIEESAAALSSFSEDPRGLLTSCRSLLDRRGHCGPLVWLAARMVAAIDPHDEAIDVVEAMDCDTTGWMLEDGLCTLRDDFTALRVVAVGEISVIGTILYVTPDWHCTGAEDPSAAATADVVVVASDCAGPSEALVPVEAAPVVEVARDSGTPVWLYTGAGRVLPEAMWRPLSKRFVPDDLADLGLAVLDLDRYVTKVVTPSGLRTPSEAAHQSDCPIVSELFAA